MSDQRALDDGEFAVVVDPGGTLLELRMEPVPLALAPDTPTADNRIGYARCSTLTQELQSQLDALAKHGIERDKVFSEKISTRVRVRPQFEAALALARQIKAHPPRCRVIFTV
jgi:Resolvase, N terminal domain